MPRQSLFLAAAFSFAPLVASQYFNADGVQNRFILYNGTVSGSFEHGDDYPSSCKDIKLGTNENAVLAVGVNPDWDSNPFFFELFHKSSEDDGGFVSFTDDTIYNLDFLSAASVCMKDGKVCGMLEYDPTYKPAEVLDLSKATVKETKIAGDAGYSVSGSKDTWVGDDKIKNEVDIARPKDAELDRCLSQEHLAWNASTPFKYDIKFTNTTSKAELSITAPKGSLTLSFSGKRDNSPKEDYASAGTAIELDTSDSSTPKFKSVDGSEIEFDDDDSESGEASETGGSETLNARKSMIYWVTGSMVALFGYLV